MAREWKYHHYLATTRMTLLEPSCNVVLDGCDEMAAGGCSPAIHFYVYFERKERENQEKSGKVTSSSCRGGVMGKRSMYLPPLQWPPDYTRIQ